jgi:hypothetical protein
MFDADSPPLKFICMGSKSLKLMSMTSIFSYNKIHTQIQGKFMVIVQY